MSGRGIITQVDFKALYEAVCRSHDGRELQVELGLFQCLDSGSDFGVVRAVNTQLLLGSFQARFSRGHLFDSLQIGRFRLILIGCGKSSFIFFHDFLHTVPVPFCAIQLCAGHSQPTRC